METGRQNIDFDEIRKFEEQARYWWDPEGPAKPLHDINPLRLRYIASRTNLQGARILDVGCGGGILSEALAAAGGAVTAIDMSETALSVARLHLWESRLDIDYRQSTVEDMAASEPGTFDAVTCLELLEHVPDPGSVVQACRTLVRRGGDIVFATLNRNIKSYLFAIIGAEYVLRLLPVGTHQHHRFIKPTELIGWAESAGLSVEDFTGMQYNPFTRHYFLSGNTDVNYFAHLRREA